MSAGAHQTRTSPLESGGWQRATSPAITSGDSPRSHSSGASSRSSSLSSAGTRLKARTPRTSSMLATPPRYGPAVSPRFPVSDDGLNGLSLLGCNTASAPGASGGGMLRVLIPREAVASILLALGVSGGAYRLVRLQAGAEPTADRCGSGDEPGQDKKVPVA